MPPTVRLRLWAPCNTHCEHDGILTQLAGPGRGKLLQGGKVTSACVHRIHAHSSQYSLESQLQEQSRKNVQERSTVPI